MRRNMSVQLLCVVALLAPVMVASGGLIRVPGDYPTIQEGLDAASTRDTVLVAAGTYYENIVWPNTGAIDLLSEDGPDSTVIDGSAAGSVISVLLEVDTTTLIRGFTIKNGSSNRGGGIYCRASHIHIEENEICYNAADSTGGGVHASNPRLVGNKVTNNWADLEGGGVWCYGSFLVVNANTLATNWAGRGGGISMNCTGEVPFCGNIVAGNTATDGAGMFCHGPGVMQANMISNNVAGNDGGGIYLECTDPRIPRIEHNTIVDNSASHLGGGIFSVNLNSPPVMNYNNIEGNTNYGVYNADASVTVNAEYNWWGHSSGPYHPTTNPTGQGDRVSDHVDYAPWLTEPFVIELEPQARTGTQRARLHQNYPNPFRLNTTIEFTTVKDCKVAVKVYDLSGRPVTTLIDDHRLQGTFAAHWDGRDETGIRVARGVYFYRLRTDRLSLTRRMVLLR